MNRDGYYCGPCRKGQPGCKGKGYRKHGCATVAPKGKPRTIKEDERHG